MSAFPIPSAITRFVSARTEPVRCSPSLAATAARAELEAACHRWLVAYSIAIVRVSVGAVFLGFGALKFFPGASPAEELTRETMGQLTFGLVPDRAGILLVAVLESTIGVCLLAGRFRRVSLVLLSVAMVGILSPLALVPEELFSPRLGVPTYAPTLEGQYVLKDIVLLAAGLVIASRFLSKHSGHDRGAMPSRHDADAGTCSRRGHGEEEPARGPSEDDGVPAGHDGGIGAGARC